MAEIIYGAERCDTKGLFNAILHSHFIDIVTGNWPKKATLEFGGNVRLDSGEYVKLDKNTVFESPVGHRIYVYVKPRED